MIAQPVRNILLIEDEGEMCLLLNLIMDDKNLSIEHVQSLSDADAFLQKKQPALILLDNRLPDGYGIDFISYLKAHYPSIKIIMISGVDAAAADLALEAGADVFLLKPFTKAKLMQSVNSLLN
jgi:DNA-binding response OmpR family regulator